MVVMDEQALEDSKPTPTPPPPPPPLPGGPAPESASTLGKSIGTIGGLPSASRYLKTIFLK
jgi:hypothetical protein